MCCCSFQVIFLERRNKEAKKHVAAEIIRRSKHQKQQTEGEGRALLEISKDNQNFKHEDENWPQTLIYPEGGSKHLFL